MCSCIVLDEEKSRQNCYTTSPAHLATFYFSSRYLISRLIFKQYPWANRPEYKERSANLQHYQQPCYYFSRVPSILQVVSMEMNEKQSFFGYIVSFLNEKSQWSGFLIRSRVLVKKRELTPGQGLNFSWILTDFIARAVCLTLFNFYWANNWGV